MTMILDCYVLSAIFFCFLKALNLGILTGMFLDDLVSWRQNTCFIHHPGGLLGVKPSIDVGDAALIVNISSSRKQAFQATWMFAILGFNSPSGLKESRGLFTTNESRVVYNDALYCFWDVRRSAAELFLAAENQGLMILGQISPVDVLRNCNLCQRWSNITGLIRQFHLKPPRKFPGCNAGLGPFSNISIWSKLLHCPSGALFLAPGSTGSLTQETPEKDGPRCVAKLQSSPTSDVSCFMFYGIFFCVCFVLALPTKGSCHPLCLCVSWTKSEMSVPLQIGNGLVSPGRWHRTPLYQQGT